MDGQGFSGNSGQERQEINLKDKNIQWLTCSQQLLKHCDKSELNMEECVVGVVLKDDVG